MDMFLRIKKPQKCRYETNAIPVPEFSDNWKFLLSNIITTETFRHNHIMQKWHSKLSKQGIIFHFINRHFSCFWGHSLWLLNDSVTFFFTLLWEYVFLFLCAYFISKFLPLLFAVSQGSYLSFFVFNTDIMYYATQNDRSVFLWLLCIW